MSSEEDERFYQLIFDTDSPDGVKSGTDFLKEHKVIMPETTWCQFPDGTICIWFIYSISDGFFKGISCLFDRVKFYDYVYSIRLIEYEDEDTIDFPEGVDYYFGSSGPVSYELSSKIISVIDGKDDPNPDKFFTDLIEIIKTQVKDLIVKHRITQEMLRNRYQIYRNGEKDDPEFNVYWLPEANKDLYLEMFSNGLQLLNPKRAKDPKDVSRLVGLTIALQKRFKMSCDVTVGFIQILNSWMQKVNSNIKSFMWKIRKFYHQNSFIHRNFNDFNKMIREDTEPKDFLRWVTQYSVEDTILKDKLIKEMGNVPSSWPLIEWLKQGISGQADAIMFINNCFLPVKKKEKVVLFTWSEIRKVWVDSGEKGGVSVIREITQDFELVKIIIGSLIQPMIKLISEGEDKEQRIKKLHEPIAIIDDFIKSIQKASLPGQILNHIIGVASRQLNISIDNFDNNEGEISIEDGRILNLSTGETRERTRKDLIQKVVPVKYVPLSEIIEDERLRSGLEFFLNEFIGNMFIKKDGTPDLDIIFFMQRWLGRMLCGTPGDRTAKIIFLLGEKQSGKTEFTNFLINLMGIDNNGYGYVTKPSFFCQDHCARDEEQHAQSLYTIKSKRFCGCSEMGIRDKLSPEKIKQRTGGDYLPVRPFMDGTLHMIQVVSSFIVSLNERQEILNLDEATWCRLAYINCMAKFVDVPDENNKLEKKAIHGIGKILNEEVIKQVAFSWMVEGAKDYLSRKHYLEKLIPDVIKNFTLDQRKEADPLMTFINFSDLITTTEREVNPCSRDCKIEKGELQSLISKYLKSVNEGKPAHKQIEITDNHLGRTMRFIGHEGKHEKGKTYYYGICATHEGKEELGLI